MRIVGGSLRGRPIASPSTEAIRPTTDRGRETLFNILAHGFAVEFGGVRVLDLFSGTGALGLEALSRGARFCLFIEQGVEARALVRTNIEAFGLQGRSKLFRRDAASLGPAGAIEPFDLLLADPPYNQRLGEAALRSAAAGGWLRSGALCVLEEASAAPFVLPEGFVLEDERTTGDTTMHFLRYSPQEIIDRTPAPAL